MVKVTKTFAEKLYPGVFFVDYLREEVHDRNPLQIENDGKMIGFKFYDQEFIIDDGDIYDGKTSNYSNYYIFGKRYSLDEIKAMREESGPNERLDILINNMDSLGYDYVCHTQVDTYFPLVDNDITMDEYYEQNNIEKPKVKERKKNNNKD